MKAAEVKVIIFLSMMIAPTVLLAVWYGRMHWLDPVFIFGVISWMIGFLGTADYLNRYVEGKK